MTSTVAPSPGGLPPDETAPRGARLSGLLRRLWWLHSAGALAFGVAAMAFARAGLAYGDKILLVLCGSWLLVFFALRFVVGPHNRRPDETLARKGVRVATNYVIKQLYQQMFFFLVPIYAASATWSWASWNWWIVPLLGVCAVVSTLDLVFDHVVMERRWLAAAMYGLAMFGVLNVLGPLVLGTDHLTGVLVAAAATPAAVAFLGFSLGQVLSPQGALVTLAATAGLLAVVFWGRAAVPPVPLAQLEATVGHGSFGSHECLPAPKRLLPADELAGLRCGSLLAAPGGLKEAVEHRYLQGERVIAVVRPAILTCDGEARDRQVVRSVLPASALPAEPQGRWRCATYTTSGQLVGLRRFTVTAPRGPALSR